MNLALYILAAAVLVAYLVVLVAGVYIDHARRQRRKRQRLLRIEIKGDTSKLADALRPTGGSYRNCEPRR